MIKVVITGSNGLLGQSLLKLLLSYKKTYKIYCFSIGKNRAMGSSFEYESIDLTKEELLKKKFLLSNQTI